MAGTDGADIVALAGAALITGALDATEGADVGSASGTLPIVGTQAGTEGADDLAYTGSVFVYGTMTGIEGSDSVTMDGLVLDDILGEFDGTDGADIAALVATVRNRSQWVIQWV